MAGFEAARRLCLLFEAGGVRYAVEATSVQEVARPDPEGDTLRGALALRDLSVLLGGPSEVRPGLALVLDVSPTLGLRITSTIEVADVAESTVFRLPVLLAGQLGHSVRGAILHGERLYLELIAEALRQGGANPQAPRPPVLLESPPERALIFESQGRLFGIPVTLVSQVVLTGASFGALPAQSGPLVGMFPHAQVLWPIYSAAGLLGAPPLKEPLILLSELAGHQVGWGAEKVLGVFGRLSPGERPGEFAVDDVGRPALFLDLQRMFS